MKSKFFELIQAYNRNKIKFYSLGLGESDEPEPDFLYSEAKKNIIFNQTRYSDSSGIMELKTEICNKLKETNNIECKEENIMVTFGAKEALFLTALTLLEDEDEVVVFTPGYISNIPILKLLKRNIKIVKVPLIPPDFHVDLNSLKKVINSKTKLLWLNYPNNPTGVILSKEEYLSICKIVEEKNIYLLSDEIYDELVFDDIKFLSFAANKSITEKIITVNSFSKSFNMTGWRIGYICADSKIIVSMKQIQKNIIGNVPVFLQKAAVSTLKNGQNYVINFRKKLEIRRNYLLKSLGNMKNIEISKPGGGFFSFIRIDKVRNNSDEFAYDLLNDKKIAVLPGFVLGKEYDNYIRISMAINTKDFENSINNIKDFIEGV
jgi:aspartate/methionine/tyrosine aminotransferase